MIVASGIPLKWNGGQTLLEELEPRDGNDRVVLRALAATLLHLANDATAASQQAHQVLGWKPRRWFETFIRQILLRSDVQTGVIGRRDVETLLRGNEHLSREISYGTTLDLSQVPPPRMRRDSRLATDRIISLNTVGDCLEWLKISPAELDWFTTIKRFRAASATSSSGASTSLAHYHLEWIPKPSGGVRLLEIPKSRLKGMQRVLLRDILRHLPPHDAAHAYREGRSIVTALAPHTGQETVWHLDLTSFFWSIGSGRVRRLFRRIGYPEAVAEILTRLSTSRVPAAILEGSPLSDREKQQLLARHLPQGAPTSPALANLSAFRLDSRLSALSHRYGVKYTRYADDLIFSGDQKFTRRVEDFRVTVLAILIDEGFQIRRRKTRVLHRGQRQQIGGLVLNQQLNIPKRDYDALRATLHNCHRRGPEGENRSGHPRFRDHLLGRIAWVEFVSPERGQKLREMFDRISWPQ